MEKLKSKSKVCITALILVLTFATVFASLPTANAARRATYAIIIASPNPVGKNQEVLIICGITEYTAWPQPGWYNVTVTVKRPDNVIETLGPVTTDTTGMTGITYKPTMAGTYYLRTNFPEQVVQAEYPGRTPPVGTIMEASVSDWLALIVTEEPRQYHPGFPLPQEYWTRPIDAQLREWRYVAGNWLNIMGYTRLAPFNDYAPEAPHILWQRVLDDGGLVGGIVGGGLEYDQLYGDDLGIIGYEHGDAYSGKFANPVIINGILYYNEYGTGFYGDIAEHRVSAVDLHTGEKLWSRPLNHNITTGERLAFGQVMYWKTMDMYGAFAYLWTTVGSTWNAYDPLTGRWEYTLTNVPSGSRVMGPKGEILIYTVNLQRGWMTLWNSTNIPDLYGSTDWTYTTPFGFLYAAWYPWGKTVNAQGPATNPTDPNLPLGRNGYMWNKTIPTGLPGSVQVVLPDRILGSNTYNILGPQQPNPVFWCISLKPGQEGTLLFNRSWTLPFPDVRVDIPDSLPVSLEDDVFVVAVKETRQYFGFNLTTGVQIWGPTTPSEPYLNTFTNNYAAPWGQSVIAYGKLYTAGMAGVVNCYDVKTGQHLWNYTIADPYTETLWSNWPAPIGFITDGKIYLFHQEHSGNTPLPRGAPAVCLNATTGEEIWRVNGLRLGTRWGGQPLIGDSIIVGLSSYDNTIVAIGKGPSATTVTATPKVVASGQSIVIEGTVLDVSPGTKDSRIALRFPNGVPAVSDESMSDWMLYVYKQFPRPHNVQGVWVKLDAINVYTGEYIDIGGTHTDSTGMFTVMWAPPKEGLWTILATFPGSNSYYPSFAETSIGVTGAPAAQAYTTLDLAIMVAVIVAIVIGVYSIYDHRKLKK